MIDEHVVIVDTVPIGRRAGAVSLFVTSSFRSRAAAGTRGCFHRPHRWARLPPRLRLFRALRMIFSNSVLTDQASAARRLEPDKDMLLRGASGYGSSPRPPCRITWYAFGAAFHDRNFGLYGDCQVSRQSSSLHHAFLTNGPAENSTEAEIGFHREPTRTYGERKEASRLSSLVGRPAYPCAMNLSHSCDRNHIVGRQSATKTCPCFHNSRRRSIAEPRRYALSV